MLRTITTIAVLPLFVLLLTSVQAFSGNYELTNDKAAFMAEYPGLKVQDFSAASISPGQTKVCPSPFTTESNNDCVSPGVIKQGLRFSGSFGGLRLYGANFPGLANAYNSLVDNAIGIFIVDFLKEKYNVVGLNIGCTAKGGPACSQTLLVEIFAPNDMAIGSTTVDATSAFNVFLGISSGEPISSIRITPEIGTDSGIFPGVSVVYFGTGPRPIPTMSEWGMIAMVAALGIIGLIYAQRRRNALKA